MKLIDADKLLNDIEKLNISNYDYIANMEQILSKQPNAIIWVPCVDGVPCTSGIYLVTYHEWSDGNYVPLYNTTVVRTMHYQKSTDFTGWNYPRCCDEEIEKDVHREVIAWKPLPPFYEK